MSKSKIKQLRHLFEVKSGFTPMQRDSSLYKTYWRKFKKADRRDK